MLIGGVVRSAVERAARVGDGFIAGLRSWEATLTQIDWSRGTGRIVPRAGAQLADDEHPVPPSTWTESKVVPAQTAV